MELNFVDNLAPLATREEEEEDVVVSGSTFSIREVTSPQPYNNDGIVHVRSVRDDASLDRTCADTAYRCRVEVVVVD